ncbi:MAG: hypothetical protein OXC13_05065 [Caldilineaceae bacterium]|nr:hypothetical protein [Caldilineaceae bacterium]
MTGTVARLSKDWLLYSQPPEMYGVPVLRAAASTEWAVTSYWKPPADIAGCQGWILDRAWYRLVANVALWRQLPNDWVQGDRVPRVEPAAGAPWVRAPYSVGHVIDPVGRQGLELRACPVLARTEAGQLVPATSCLLDTAGRDWLRIEFRQMVLWTLADTSRVRNVSEQAVSYRSCESVVMFPPPPHTLCPVVADGRFLDPLVRQYHRLDPEFECLPSKVLGGEP